MIIPTLKIKTLAPDVILPKRQTSGSAGYDICSYVDCIIEPNTSYLVETKLSFTVPEERMDN